MAAPLNTVTNQEPINHGDANFDPVAHAEKANKEHLERLQQNHDSEIRRLQEDATARTQELRSEIEKMREDIKSAAQIQPSAPAEPRVSLEEKYAMTSDEKEQFGEMIDVVDKRSALFAERAYEAALQKSHDMFSSREAKMQEELDALKAKVGQVDQGVTQNFEASARARAANYGLELEELMQNSDWQTLMSQPISAVNDTTYGKYVDQAIQSQDMRSLERVFQYFANEYKTPSGSTLTGLPASTRVDPAPSGQPQQAEPDGIMGQLQVLESEQLELREAIAHRHISTDEFKAKMQVLNDKIIALRKQLN